MPENNEYIASIHNNNINNSNHNSNKSNSKSVDFPSSTIDSESSQRQQLHERRRHHNLNSNAHQRFDNHSLPLDTAPPRRRMSQKPDVALKMFDNSRYMDRYFDDDMHQSDDHADAQQNTFCLAVRQQPGKCRAIGFGVDTGNGRPIDPSVIVQLGVVRPSGDIDFSLSALGNVSMFVAHAVLLSADGLEDRSVIIIPSISIPFDYSADPEAVGVNSSSSDVVPPMAESTTSTMPFPTSSSAVDSSRPLSPPASHKADASSSVSSSLSSSSLSSTLAEPKSTSPPTSSSSNTTSSSSSGIVTAANQFSAKSVSSSSISGNTKKTRSRGCSAEAVTLASVSSSSLSCSTGTITDTTNTANPSGNCSSTVSGNFISKSSECAATANNMHPKPFSHIPHVVFPPESSSRFISKNVGNRSQCDSGGSGGCGSGSDSDGVRAGGSGGNVGSGDGSSGSPSDPPSLTNTTSASSNSMTMSGDDSSEEKRRNRKNESGRDSGSNSDGATMNGFSNSSRSREGSGSGDGDGDSGSGTGTCNDNSLAGSGDGDGSTALTMLEDGVSSGSVAREHDQDSLQHLQQHGDQPLNGDGYHHHHHHHHHHHYHHHHHHLDGEGGENEEGRCCDGVTCDIAAGSNYGGGNGLEMIMAAQEDITTEKKGLIRSGGYKDEGVVCSGVLARRRDSIEKDDEEDEMVDDNDNVGPGCKVRLRLDAGSGDEGAADEIGSFHSSRSGRDSGACSGSSGDDGCSLEMQVSSSGSAPDSNGNLSPTNDLVGDMILGADGNAIKEVSDKSHTQDSFDIEMGQQESGVIENLNHLMNQHNKSREDGDFGAAVGVTMDMYSGSNDGDLQSGGKDNSTESCDDVAAKKSNDDDSTSEFPSDFRRRRAKTSPLPTFKSSSVPQSSSFHPSGLISYASPTDPSTVPALDPASLTRSLLAVSTPQKWKRTLSGGLVSSCHLLTDLNGKRGAYFVFSDLCVRVEGIFRLKVLLLDLRLASTSKEAIDREKTDQLLASILTEPFVCQVPREWTGAQESSDLAKHFADQGIKIPIRRKARKHNDNE